MIELSLDTWVSVTAISTALITMYGMLRRGARNDMKVFRVEFTGNIAELRTATEGSITRLDGSIGSLRTELKGEISGLRTELTGDIAELRTGTEGSITRLRTELTGDIAGLRTATEGSIARLEGAIKHLDQRTTRIETNLVEFRRETKVDITRLDDRLYALAIGLKPLIDHPEQAAAAG